MLKRYYNGEAVVSALNDIAEAAHALYGCDKEFVYGTMLRKIENHSIFVAEDQIGINVICNEEHKEEA